MPPRILQRLPHAHIPACDCIAPGEGTWQHRLRSAGSSSPLSTKELHNDKLVQSGDGTQLESAPVSMKVEASCCTPNSPVGSKKEEVAQRHLKLGDESREERYERQPQSEATAAALDSSAAAAAVLGSEAELVMLGTGAAIPSKYRNVSATLLCLRGQRQSEVNITGGSGDSGVRSGVGGSSGADDTYRCQAGVSDPPASKAKAEVAAILFDAGEGTYASICRRFGRDTDRIVKGLRAIWISHMHADHHLGLIKVRIVCKRTGARRNYHLCIQGVQL